MYLTRGARRLVDYWYKVLKHPLWGPVVAATGGAVAGYLLMNWSREDIFVAPITTCYELLINYGGAELFCLLLDILAFLFEVTIACLVVSLPISLVWWARDRVIKKWRHRRRKLGNKTNPSSTRKRQ